MPAKFEGCYWASCESRRRHASLSTDHHNANAAVDCSGFDGAESAAVLRYENRLHNSVVVADCSGHSHRCYHGWYSLNLASLKQ